MEINSLISIAIEQFPILTIFLATLIFGEEVVIILGFLSGLGLISIWALFIFGFIGTFFSDLLWFFIGKFFLSERRKKNFLHKRYHRIKRHLDRISPANNFLALMFARFFYLFRIFALMHIGSKKISLKKFFFYEIPIIGVWLTVFIALGWFFGSAALKYLNIFADFQKIIIGFIIFILLFLVLKKFLQKFFEKAN